MTGQQAAERKPVLLGNLSLRNEQKAGKPGFGCQHVVAGRIATPFTYIVTDALKKFKIHNCKFAAAIHQIVDDPEPLRRTLIK